MKNVKTYKDKQIAEAFFVIDTSTDSGICKFCKQKKDQDHSKGHGNYASHAKLCRKQDWMERVDEYLEKGTAGQNTLPFVSDKGKSYYQWLDWVLSNNLPFSFVESAETKKYAGIVHNMCVDTFMKVLKTVGRKVASKIIEDLPDSFGLIIDGWDAGGGSHRTGIFAVFPDKSRQDLFAKTPLLAVSPMHDETSFTASTMYTFIKGVLRKYQKSEDNVVFLVMDNTNVNHALARCFEVPLIGCASHRLNLAAKKLFSEYEEILTKVDAIMTKISTAKVSGALREITDIGAKKRNTTRWSSTHVFVTRYFELKEHLLTLDDPEVTALMLTHAEDSELQVLRTKLKDFESCTKKLQFEEGISLSTVRTLFDALLSKYPEVCETHLAVSAAIINSQAFETGIVKIVDGKKNELTDAEKEAVQCFKLNNRNANAAASPEPDDFASKALKQAKRQRVAEDDEYQQLSWIPPTSNVVERLFSRAKLTLGTLRRSILPENLEIILMLRANRSLWDLRTVGELVMDPSNQF